jgi:S-disulfanyl-L-cysteine oxidoreductase SoxD
LAIATASFAGARSGPTYAQELAAPRARSVWDGVYTQAQAERGKTLYTKVCSDCHDEDLTTPGDDMTSTLAGPDFMAAWNGLTAGDLYERIHNTMPIDHPGTLPKQTIVDVMAYMFRYNQFPAGNAELPVDTKMLKLITIAWKPDPK